VLTIGALDAAPVSEKGGKVWYEKLVDSWFLLYSSGTVRHANPIGIVTQIDKDPQRQSQQGERSNKSNHRAGLFLGRFGRGTCRMQDQMHEIS
jgi:hypothetical protein